MVAYKKGTVGYYEAQYKRKQTLIAKHGSEEAVNEWFRSLGSLGGVKCNPNKGFGSNRELASKAGAIGGKIGKRGKAKNV